MPIDFSKTFRRKTGALAFFTSILFWGVGCFMAALPVAKPSLQK